MVDSINIVVGPLWPPTTNAPTEGSVKAGSQLECVYVDIGGDDGIDDNGMMIITYVLLVVLACQHVAARAGFALA